MRPPAERAPGIPNERDRVVALLRKYGWNSTSFQVLEPGFRYWFDGPDACVAFVDTGSAWVLAGAPLAERERFPEVMRRFVVDARANRRRVACFATEARFHETVGWPALRIGDQPCWALGDWVEALRQSRGLREQLRRATAKGVTVRQVGADELAPGHPTRAQLDALIRRWLATRPMAPMGFLVQVDPFTLPEERRHFVAEREGRIEGFLGVVPVYVRRGWFFEDLLRDPDAPNGTSELLVDAAMRAAEAEGVPYLTLGLVPLSGDVGPWLGVARRFGRALYDFDGLRAFKAKLKPGTWDPIFLAYPPGGSWIVALADTLTAFARGGLLRFGVETLLRGPAIVVRVLAVLLIPWTILLALPSSTRWFPSPAWQWVWVAFDVLVCVALLSLASRWRAWLGNLLALVVSADAVVTAIQAFAFDWPRRRGPLDAAVLAIGVLAPTVAAVLLWNARAHRLDLD